MLIACTTATESHYASTGDAMYLIFGSTTTGAVGTTQDIDHIGRLVVRASRWADIEINGDGDAGEIGLQVIAESLPAFGGRELMVTRVPLVKVLRLFDSTSTCTGNEYCSTDYVVRSYKSGIVERTAGFAWTADRYDGESAFNLGLTPAYRSEQMSRPWYIEYVAGYRPVGSTATCHGMSTADENWTTGQTLPEDITHAVAVRAAELYSNPMNVVRRKVGDLDVTYGSAGPGKSSASWMLEPYKRIKL